VAGVLSVGNPQSPLGVPNSGWANNVSHTYYCRLTINGASANTNTVTLTHTVASAAFTNTGGGTPSQTIPAQPATSLTISSSTVDNSSYMYELLSTKCSKPNFMSQSELAAAENQDKLKKYVNLSKPEIVFSDAAPNGEPYPAEYSNNNGVISSLLPKNGSYYLEYYFSVRNDADTDPANTRYTCNLYIDSNGDGRYSDSERLSDIIIRQWDSATNTVGARISASELRADTEYYVSRAMPSDKYGIIPWKLEIVKSGTGNTATHTSIHKYTHIPTAAGNQVRLDILQINASGGLSLEAQMQPGGVYYSSVTNTYYQGIYGKLLADVSNDFNVSITTVLTGDVDPIAGRTVTHGGAHIQTCWIT